MSCDFCVLCIAGMLVTYKNPCIDSIQGAEPLSSLLWCGCRIGYAMIDDAEKAGKITPGKVSRWRRWRCHRVVRAWGNSPNGETCVTSRQ